MSPEETRAFESLSGKDRVVVAAYAKMLAELDTAGREEARAESDLERARTRRLKAQAEYKKASEALLALLSENA